MRFPSRRSPRHKARSPSLSTNQSVLDRIGPIVSVKARLGRYMGTRDGINCYFCGDPKHGAGTVRERKLHCEAYGMICRNCGKINHVAKMCRVTNIVVVTSDEEDGANNNNNVKEERWMFTTIDEIGYTEVQIDENDVKQEKKVEVDLDKIVINRRHQSL